MTPSGDPAAPKPSLWRDLKDIWRVAGWLSLAIIATTLGMSGVLTALLGPMNDVRIIVFATWPLVITGAILFMMIMRGSFDGMSGPVGLATVFLAFLIPYLLAVWTGAARWDREILGQAEGGIVGIFKWIAGGIFGIGKYYVVSYGLVRTGLALACALFLAWALQSRLLPHVHRLMAAGERPTGRTPA